MTSELPNSCEVVVVGGGIVGVSTACFLARKGIPVVLCEKGRIAGEQSSRNWGFIRKQGRHPAEIPLMVRALELWHELVPEMDEDIGFHVRGTLYLSETEKRYAANQAWMEHAKAFELDTRMLSRHELQELVPEIQNQQRGALYTPSDARAEPEAATRAIARIAEKHGATFLESCAVRGVDIEAGRVAGVVTEKGRIRCSAVVLAGGVWSSYFCRHLDLRLPQLKVISSVMATEPTSFSLEQNLWSSGLGLRKRLDGGFNVAYGGNSDLEITPDFLRYFAKFLPAYRQSKEVVNLKPGTRFFKELAWPSKWSFDQVTPFEKERTLDPPPNEKLLDKAYLLLGQNFPNLKGIGISHKWAGMIDVTPDELPVIDTVDSIPGLTISTGYSGHGFGIGPGAGWATAQICTGDTPDISLDALSLQRLRM